MGVGESTGTERLYEFLVEEEDARACTDISEDACTEVPANFFKIGIAQVLTKLADEITSAKTVLPWLLVSLGASPAWIGFLVPIRESGSLLPQLFIASAVRRRPRRKDLWALGGVLQAVFLAGMALVAVGLEGAAAGAVLIATLLLFSLARGLVSVASKDVVGKTIPKRRRGRLTGFTTAAAGLLALAAGGVLVAAVRDEPSRATLALLLLGGSALWIVASALLARVAEEAGATEGGRNAVREALRRLSLLRTDPAFRRFVTVRALLVSTGLAAPYYVAIARRSGGGGELLALFVLASGLAAALSSLFWGRYSDRSSRSVLVAAAATGSALGVLVFILDFFGAIGRLPWIAPLAFFVLAIAHSGVRIGRKTYILDLAGGDRRTDYVAVGNTVIGIVLLAGGVLGTLSAILGPAGMLLVLALFGLAGAVGGLGLPEVQ